jgi:hypothetical protein
MAAVDEFLAELPDFAPAIQRPLKSPWCHDMDVALGGTILTEGN